MPYVRALSLCIIFAIGSASAVEAPALAMHLAVDATALPGQGLLRATMTIPVSGHAVTLRYPEWIPGTHAPSGPVQNLGGLAMHDEQGRAAAWERDSRDAYRFRVELPESAKSLTIEMVYIANQPTDNSEGVDIIGTADLGLVNWNCCLLMPDGMAPARIDCQANLSLPADWSWSSALAEAPRTGDTVAFPIVALDRLIDCPVLIGRTLERFRLHAADANGPEVMLHVASPARSEPWRDERWLTHLRQLPDQARALFGGAWYGRYDFLLLRGNEPLGLEHADCSVVGIGPDSADFDAAGTWEKELLPHEFVHSWVGKYRRPAGMLTGDFSTVPVQDSLWVYEGLTEHLGRVLAVRSGLLTPAQWRTAIANDLHDLSSMPGRRWRSLRDTCRSTHLLRGSSAHHGELRRDQDYYLEGALFWLAADLRIRSASHGEHDLDEVCRSFFGPTGERAPGYEEAQLVAALTKVCPEDWSARIHRWIDETGDLDSSFLDGSGWRLDNGPAQPGEIDPAEIGPQTLMKAIGLVAPDGWVAMVVPDSPAAQSGLLAGDFIYSVDGIELAKDPLALVKATMASPTRGSMTLYACRDRKEWTKRVVRYDGGLRVARLARVDGEADAFDAILAPRAKPMPVAVPP